MGVKPSLQIVYAKRKRKKIKNTQKNGFYFRKMSIGTDPVVKR